MSAFKQYSRVGTIKHQKPVDYPNIVCNEWSLSDLPVSKIEILNGLSA